jgi:hypothetical protein
MTDVDPYVAPPAERLPPPRLVGIRPVLVVAVVVLLLTAIAARDGVDPRQDPTVPAPEQVPDQPLIPVLPQQ